MKPLATKCFAAKSSRVFNWRKTVSASARKSRQKSANLVPAYVKSLFHIGGAREAKGRRFVFVMDGMHFPVLLSTIFSVLQGAIGAGIRFVSKTKGMRMSGKKAILPPFRMA